jgi:predicted HicB family RNase H-like nuclease
MLKYKGYKGYAVYDAEAKIFHGDVLGLRAVITFQGKTTEELEQAFKDSIDDYLEWCKERGKKPQKSYSGKLNVRLAPELHEKLSHESILAGKSLNSLIVEKLKK